MPATKLKQLNDTEILRIARLRVTESANSTFTQDSLDTQLSVERGVIWLVHFIEFYFPNLSLLSEVAAAGTESVTAQITRESKTSQTTGSDSDLVQMSSHFLSRSAAVGTDAGPLYYFADALRRFDYPMPLPYASQNMYVNIQGTDAATPHSIDVRVGYSIVEVSDAFFFRVASALLG